LVIFYNTLGFYPHVFTTRLFYAQSVFRFIHTIKLLSSWGFIFSLNKDNHTPTKTITKYI